MSEDGSDCQCEWRGMFKNAWTNIKWEEKHPAIWSQVRYYSELEGESLQQYMRVKNDFLKLYTLLSLSQKNWAARGFLCLLGTNTRFQTPQNFTSRPSLKLCRQRIMTNGDKLVSFSTLNVIADKNTKTCERLVTI